MPTTIAELARMKAAGEPIAMVTCYDHASALLCQAAGMKVLLVGDSLGQVVLGHRDTLSVSVGDMVRHAAAVVRGAPDALVVGDLPFLSYTSPAQAIESAGRLMREGQVGVVKLEGGRSIAPTVRTLVDFGIPVMGHLGFTPQSSHQIGVKVQGKSAEAAAAIIADADALQAAGACAIVLELIPAALAWAITERLTIPTIGIGAGAGCSGQVQVWHDILGFSGKPPFRHTRRFGEVGAAITSALSDYAGSVADGSFPTAANAATMDEAVVTAALALADRD
ncbi:3-methyl-2-oxobutanoate hydroxymethyltransferase [Sphingomonas naphthae]|uniref:3-methyl-2-oxobutanoate hydroxymethyltransferase n=1 Tax=Sphingomonas naphthae TaxID=1813468 RepID=A0ABY7TJG2_9SPHN|nr:3-methyl-2-oxobutanoate hydroxymethyltransferase [Sphingomonas naphthae]WCT72550.1 3-methyl-2-oxobutanoate hydroxymethyltransferase [Sphingomonas naphthae]